jgi:hypothetical protein
VDHLHGGYEGIEEIISPVQHRRGAGDRKEVWRSAAEETSMSGMDGTEVHMQLRMGCWSGSEQLTGQLTADFIPSHPRRTVFPRVSEKGKTKSVHSQADAVAHKRATENGTYMWPHPLTRRESGAPLFPFAASRGHSCVRPLPVEREIPYFCHIAMSTHQGGVITYVLRRDD